MSVRAVSASNSLSAGRWYRMASDGHCSLPGEEGGGRRERLILCFYITLVVHTCSCSHHLFCNLKEIVLHFVFQYYFDRGKLFRVIRANVFYNYAHAQYLGGKACYEKWRLVFPE